MTDRKPSASPGPVDATLERIDALIVKANNHLRWAVQTYPRDGDVMAARVAVGELSELFSPAPSPSPAPAPLGYEDARLAYANACEALGMAHANGTRAEWEAAERREVETRRALDAIVRPAPSPRPDMQEIERLVDAAMLWARYDKEAIDYRSSMLHVLPPGGHAARTALLSAIRAATGDGPDLAAALRVQNDLALERLNRAVAAESSLARLRERVAAALVAAETDLSAHVSTRSLATQARAALAAAPAEKEERNG